jgi:hypothetical protein
MTTTLRAVPGIDHPDVQNPALNLKPGSRVFYAGDRRLAGSYEIVRVTPKFYVGQNRAFPELVQLPKEHCVED